MLQEFIFADHFGDSMSCDKVNSLNVLFTCFLKSSLNTV